MFARRKARRGGRPGLEQAGLIKVERREITIVDAERLAVCQG